jgi:hypothetical protein
MVTLTPCSTSPSAPSPQKQEELGPAPCFPKLHSLLNDDLRLAEPGDLAAPRGVGVCTANSGISITSTHVVPVEAPVSPSDATVAAAATAPWTDTPTSTLAGRFAVAAV